MFLREKQKGTRRCFYVVKSVRIDGQPRQHTVKYLGSIAHDSISKLRRYHTLLEMKPYFDISRDYDAQAHSLAQETVDRFWQQVDEKVSRFPAQLRRSIVSQLQQRLPLSTPVKGQRDRH